MANDDPNQLKEYLLSINEFVQPKVLKGESAAFADILRLFLLEPGTNQTHPKMGIGIRSRYRFSDTSEINKLKQEVKDQMETYLPNLLVMDVQVEVYGTTVAIFISSQDEVFAVGYNTLNGKVTSLTLDDIK